MPLLMLPPQLIRMCDGTLRELGRVFCSACREPMPEPGSGENCWGIPGEGVFHADCYAIPQAPEST